MHAVAAYNAKAPKLPKFLGVEDEKSAPPVSQARRMARQSSKPGRLALLGLQPRALSMWLLPTTLEEGKGGIVIQRHLNLVRSLIISDWSPRPSFCSHKVIFACTKNLCKSRMQPNSPSLVHRFETEGSQHQAKVLRAGCTDAHPHSIHSSIDPQAICRQGEPPPH